MNDKQTKRIEYLVYNKPLREYLAEVTSRGTPTLWKYTAPKRELTAEQALAQGRCSYSANPTSYVSISRYEIEKAVGRIADKLIEDKFDGDFKQKIFVEVMDLPVRTTISVDNGTFSHNDYLGDSDGYKERNIVDDKDKLKTRLDTAKLIIRFGRVQEYGVDGVYIDSVTVTAQYGLDRVKDELNSCINRYVKDNLIYCLKNGKINVPKEYLDKGKAGLAEYRDTKRSKSKHNSLENRMERELLRSKKQELRDKLVAAQDTIEKDYNWKLPFLKVDGRWSQTRQMALVSKILKGKTNSEIIALTDDDILKMAKGYWRDKLTEALARVDSM